MAIRTEISDYEGCADFNEGIRFGLRTALEIIDKNIQPKKIVGKLIIPDNATNEDIINTMFDRDMAYNIRCYVKNYMLMGEWLDAPYQKGGKE